MPLLSTTPPPTAGLPLQRGDLWPWRSADLAGGLAQFLGVPCVQLECSGTAALMLALRTLQRIAPARTEVVAPAYTCPLVALAVAQCGLQLRLCDLRADALDMEPARLQALCSAQTLAVLPTHLCGRVTDVATAVACAHAVGAWVIEDAAQALGARAHGAAVGWLGDIGFYSLAVGKGLTTFEGGVLLSRHAGMRAALQATSAACVPSSRWWELRRSLELLGYAALYRPAGLALAYGRPLRRALARGDWVEAAGDDVAAAIPLHRLGRWRQRVAWRALQRLPAFQAALAGQAAQRCARLAAIDGVQLVGDSPAVEDARGVWPVLLLRLPSARARDAFMRTHWGAGWGLSLPFVQVLPDYGRYDAALGRARADGCGQARDWASRLVAISNSPWLDDARFAQLIQALQQLPEAQD